MTSNNAILFLIGGLLLCIFPGCQTDSLVDTNESLPQRNWSYVKKIKAVVEVKDPATAYDLRFNLRLTANYRYANIHILMHMSGPPGQAQVTRRYTYRLAQKDGRWMGKGSGNLYTYQLPLLRNYHFSRPGNYVIEIEQNMRDNPLKEISDAGISVSRN